MDSTTHHIRRRPRVHPLRFEWLEMRLALSAPGGSSELGIIPAPEGLGTEIGATVQSTPLAVVATDPAPDAVVAAPVGWLTLVFSRPVDPATLGADVVLERLAEDGGVVDRTPLTQEVLDPTGMVLVATPEGPLAPGRYRLLIAGDSGLAAPDGSPLVGGGADLPLADFTVAETAAAPLLVVATDPAPGTILSAPPEAITIQFNRALNPDRLSSDVILTRLAEDDSVSWWTALDQATLDPTGTRLLATVGRPLPPGHYQILIVGSSEIADRDGVLLITDGQVLRLADFSLIPPGISLASATDLGTIGPDPSTVPGLLDLTANPSAVALFTIHLETGHFWRLGLEVQAERDGGTLNSALALFDNRGRPIATAEYGRPDAPSDPYLFAGLPPGTYYVGVSGTGNLPDRPGGYDLTTGSAGSVPQLQPGGPYTLHLVADAVDSPTQLLSLALDRADPLTSQPTGLTLGFSGAIRLDPRSDGLYSDLSGAIEVVDQSGHLWPVVASSYAESRAQISYLFRQRLPEGSYTIHLSEPGGLVDLTGRPSMAPGQPAGVLGTFTVGPDQGPGDPFDLGALLPDAALEGVELNADLAPSESVAYRVVLTFPATYSLQGRYSGRALTLSLIGPGGTVSLELDPGSPDSWNGTDLKLLQPGEYLLRLRASGGESVSAGYLLKVPALTPEQLLANGIGQGPGLSLRLIGPLGWDSPRPPSSITSPPAPLPPVPPPSPRDSPSSPLPPPPPSVLSGVRGPTPPSRGVSAWPGPTPGDAEPAGAPRGASAGLSLGFGVLVGRPTSVLPLAVLAGSGSRPGGDASAFDLSGFPEGIGLGSGSGPIGSRGPHSEVGVDPGRSGGEQVAPSFAGPFRDPDRDGAPEEETPHLADLGPGPMLDTLHAWLDQGPRESLGGGELPGEPAGAVLTTSPGAELDPPRAQDSVDTLSPLSLGLVAALIIQARQQVAHALGRLLGGNPGRSLA